MRFKHFLLLFCAALAFASCTTRTHEGVELGNPNGGVKSMRIATGNLLYDVFFTNESDALVTRTDAPDGDSESVTVPYRREGASLSLSAEFSDGQTIDLTALLDTGGNVVSGVLKINGEPVAASFEEPDLPAADQPSETTQNDVADTSDLQVPGGDEVGPEEPPPPQETVYLGEELPNLDTVNDPPPPPKPDNAPFEDYGPSSMQ